MKTRTAILLSLLGAGAAGMAAFVLRHQRPTLQLLGAGLAFGVPWAVQAAVRKATCSVLFVTDTHGPAASNEALVRAMLTESGISRVAHAGDVFDSADLATAWWDRPFADVVQRWPVDAASGNHDVADAASSAAFTARFGLLPKAVTCGNAEFFFLPWDADRQDAEWVHSRARASHAKWKVLVTHRPIWDVDGTGTRLRGLVLSALSYIDLVLAGHEHVAYDTWHNVGGHPVHQIIDVSGPKKYVCNDVEGCVEGETAYWRIDFFDDEIVAERRVVL